MYGGVHHHTIALATAQAQAGRFAPRDRVYAISEGLFIMAAPICGHTEEGLMLLYIRINLSLCKALACMTVCCVGEHEH